MSRIGNLWPYDLGRQSLIAFALGFLIVAAMAAIIAGVQSLGDSLCAEGACSEYIEAERARGEVRGRYLAERDAQEQAPQRGAEAGRRDLDGLLRHGSHSEGYALAYTHAWNDIVNQLARRQPSQLLAQQDGTQWIELLRTDTQQ